MPHERTVLPLFLIAEAVTYFAFLLCDLAGFQFAGTVLKYGALLLCLLYSLTNLGQQDGRLVAAALGFTALADLFLLVWNQNYALGVGCFCLVQALYALRLYRAHGGTPPCLWLRLPLCAAALAGLWYWQLLEPLTVLASLYVTQLLCSVGESLLLPPSRLRWLLSAGLLLLLCGDLCVGLYNAGEYIFLPPGPLTSFAPFGIWLFYLPSQVLIALSPQKGGACEA